MPPTASFHLTLALQAWEISSEVPSLQGAVERIGALLFPVVAVDSLHVWGIARDGISAELLAAAVRKGRQGTAVETRRLDDELSRRLRALSGEVVPVPAGASPLHATFGVAEASEGLVIALHDRESLTGLAALWGPPPLTSATDAIAVMGELGGPLAAALRLHRERDTVSREKEALEADRRALLQRLDRDDVSDTIVGAESGLRDVMIRIDQVAPTDAPVLLLGETGSGKEVVARAIHRRSRRASGPIVRVNCGAIPHGLIDSELFGHEKGSFTGAINTRKGWFERADGGTLFLDEVGELPLDAQIRLLRILQDGVFERVGAQRSHRVDVRIIAATHRDPRQMVAEKSFREDLWYRLSVFPITIPPVRNRPEDIPALAAHFASRAGVRIGGSPIYLGESDVDLLLAYSWPGNVRELAAVIERAVILGDGKRLRLSAALGQAPLRSSDVPGVQATDDPVITSLADAMARHIERALRACGGRVEGAAGAAALLRINPHTLRARMRKLGVEWSTIRDEVRRGELAER
jgi:hydrogenase-4 transcriptional activator